VPEDPELERSPSQGIGAARLLRFALFLLVVVGGFLFLRFGPYAEDLAPEVLVERLRDIAQLPWAPWIFLLIGIVLTTVGIPATPIIFAGGAVFGAVYGGILSYSALMGGAAVGYVMAKTLARDLAIRLGGKTLVQIEARLARWGFWTLVRLRFVPIPFAITNYAAALVGIPAGAYLLSTALGLIPSTALMAYFSEALTSTAGDRSGAFRDLLIASGLLVLLSFLPGRIIAWRDRER